MSGGRCECDWTYHQGIPCGTPAADHGTVRTSPELCMQCLFVCCGEREDAEDAEDAVAGPLREAGGDGYRRKPT